jgi:S-formylglutathione hydrolase FrmB
MVDVTFLSASLNRDMPYRTIVPANIAPNQKLPVLYLLHGGGGGYRDWSNYSDVAGYAAQGLILVMPEGNSSYYTNSADRPQDRYEDYIVHDLIADVEQRLPAASGRPNRAIAGVSMGGFGAIVTCLFSQVVLALRWMFPAALSRSNGSVNTVSTAPSLDRGKARAGARAILSSWSDPPIRPPHHIFFLRAATRKVFCLQTTDSPPCCKLAIFTTSSRLPLEVTTGTSGTAMFLT